MLESGECFESDSGGHSPSSCTSVCPATALSMHAEFLMGEIELEGAVS